MNDDSPGDVMEGELFQNRYQILDKIGQGGMARVYRALDRKMQRHVAVKILREELVPDATFVERFRHEALAVASLSHPNVVSVYDHGATDNSYFIVMEYVDGVDLKSYLQRRGRLPAPEAVSLALQICAGVQEAHKKGLVHRDIKPQNILLTDEGRVKVVDFGIARAVNSASPGLTTTGVALGSVQYISPEQARGDKVQPSSDVYAMGVVLFEMLTGRLPFQGATAVEVALKHIQERPPRVAAFESSVPPALESVVARALEKDPARRYANAAELRGALLESDNDADGVTRLVPVLPISQADSGSRLGSDTGETTVVSSLETRYFWAQDVAYNPHSDPQPEIAPRGGWSRRLSRLAGLALIIALLVAGGLWAYRVLPGLHFPVASFAPDVPGQVVREANTATATPGASATSEPTQPPSETEGARIQVPGVVGGNLSAAQEKAAHAHLTLVVGGSRTDQVAPVGTVVEQYPSSGEYASVGDQLVVVVSKGPDTVQVPELRGQSLAQAEETLKRVGLTVGRRVGRPSPDVPANAVVEQSPDAGSTVDRGSRVNIVVSEGPPTVSPPPPSPSPAPTNTPRPSTSTPVTTTPAAQTPTTSAPTSTPAPPTPTPSAKPTAPPSTTPEPPATPPAAAPASDSQLGQGTLQGAVNTLRQLTDTASSTASGGGE